MLNKNMFQKINKSECFLNNLSKMYFFMNKKYIFGKRFIITMVKNIILFFWLHIALFSLNNVTFAGETKKLIEKAEKAFYEQNFELAYECYDKLAELMPEGKAYYDFKKGSCLIELRKNAPLALTLIKSNEELLSTSDVRDEYYFYLARALHLNERFDEAIQSFTTSLESLSLEDDFLKNLINREIEMSSNAKKAYEAKQNYEILNIQNPINTSYPEYKPVISADESVLIFTSRRPENTGGLKDIDGKYFEDIYISSRDKYGYWENPKNIGTNVNTSNHEASVSLSADGRKLIFYKGGKNSGSLFYSFLEADVWGTPMLIDNGATINSKKYWETSASVSLDEKVVYFTSDRKEGKGGLDIYKCEKLENGEWGTPQNISEINSPYDEESPFIHPDGKTLYFASNSGNSIGGFDIFKSVYEDGKWSAPVNMGYPINTVFDDLHFVLTADGKKGFFTSSRNNVDGMDDIYRVTLDEDVRPLVLIKGVVRTENNQEILASIDVFGKEDNEKQKYVYNPNIKTGKYLMILPPGKSYNMIISAEGYDNYQIELNIPDQEHFHEFYQEILLKKTGSGDLVSENITVVNSFEDLRVTEKLDPKLKQANPDYLKDLVKDIVELTDSSQNDENARLALEQKINTVKDITDEVTDQYQRVVTNEAYTEAVTYSGSPSDSINKQPLIIDNDTLLVVSYDKFKNTDFKEKPKEDEQTLASSDVKKDSDQPLKTDEKLDNSSESITSLKDKNALILPDVVTVLFDFNSIAVNPEYHKNLNVLTDFYIKNKDKVNLVIEGHTDALGKSEYNLNLSKRRANSVLAYLTSQKIAKNSVKLEFYGEDRPAQPNTKPDGSDNPEGRSKNRRAVVKAVLK